MTTFLQRLASFYAVFLLLLPVASCKRETLPEDQYQSPPVYSITFKLDGVEHTYTRPLLATTFTAFNPDLGFGLFTCLGMRDTALAGENQISLYLCDSIPLQTNITYTNYTTNQPNERALINGGLSFDYFTADGVLTFTHNESSLSVGTIHDARLTITEVTPEYVRGRFSGTVYGIVNNLPSHVITDGVFTMGRIY
jgi:hypothetical protein